MKPPGQPFLIQFWIDAVELGTYVAMDIGVLRIIMPHCSTYMRVLVYLGHSFRQTLSFYAILYYMWAAVASRVARG